jgi:hypothetical protein
MGSRRASIGMGVEIGPRQRRRSIRSTGQRPARAYLPPEEAVPDVVEGKWDENMEKALEDILHVRVSPEGSEVSVSGEEADEDDDILEDDDDMPLLEEGVEEANTLWSEGGEELDSQALEGVLEDVPTAEEEAAVLKAEGQSSRLNDLIVEERRGGAIGHGDSAPQNGSRAKQGGVQKRLAGQAKLTESTDGLTRSVSGDGHLRRTENEACQTEDAIPVRSRSLDSAKGPKPNGVKKPNQESCKNVDSVQGFTSGNCVNGGRLSSKSGLDSAGDSPHTRVYSRFLSRGLAKKGSSGSLAEQTPEVDRVSVISPGRRGDPHLDEFLSSTRAGGQPEEPEFRDALETLTPTVSDASMQDAVEDNDWVTEGFARTNGSADRTEHGGEMSSGDLSEVHEERGGEPSILGMLAGGLRRRGSGKKQD